MEKFLLEVVPIDPMVNMLTVGERVSQMQNIKYRTGVSRKRNPRFE